MSTTDTAPASATTDRAETGAIPLTTPLPELRTALTAAEITARLDAASRRGRLPGYRSGGAAGALFEVRDFGAPFEGVLSAHLEGQVLRLAVSMQRRMPVVAALILVLSIWPGVWFTESALASIFTSAEYMWKWTYWWYLPMAILSAPWAMWSLVSRSRASIHAGAHELVGKIAAELGAKVGAR